MPKIFRIKKHAFMSLFVVILMWTYFVIASTSSLDVRFDDGALNLNEMYWYEAALFLVGFPLNFAFIFTALWHAWKTDRKKLFCVVFFCWPISFHYVLRFRVESDKVS